MMLSLHWRYRIVYCLLGDPYDLHIAYVSWGGDGKRRPVLVLSSNPRLRREMIMRLDKYLKVSRIIKRRTVANEACDAGRVEINGKPAKASQEVKPDDEIAIRFGDKLTKVKVLAVKETVRKEDAATLYQMLQ